MTRRSAGIVLAVAVFAVSWAAILVRLAAEAGAGVIAFYRLAIAAAVLAPFALGTRGRSPAIARGRLAPRIVAAGVLLGVHFVAWFVSLEYTSVASSVLLVQTQPLFAAVLAPWLLGEPTGRTTWLAVILALAGALVVGASDLGAGRGVGTGGAHPLLGDLLALLAALCAVLYFIVGRSLRVRMPLVPYLTVVNGVAALSVLAWVLLRGEAMTGFPPAVWGIFALLALGPSLAGHGLLNLSVRHLRAQTVNLALLGEPVLATVYAMILLAERPPALFYPGAVLVAAGLVVASRGERRR